MDKIVAFDETGPLDDSMSLQQTNKVGTPGYSPATSAKKCSYFNADRGIVVRSEGLEPPRFYSLPPQGSASTNSATSAWEDRPGTERPGRINGVDVTNQCWRDKACCHP